MSTIRRKPSAYTPVISEVRTGNVATVTHPCGYRYSVNLDTTGADVKTCENFKAGDKVTILGIGIAFVREVIAGWGYELFIVNQRRTGGGWEDKDLRPGWSAYATK